MKKWVLLLCILLVFPSIYAFKPYEKIKLLSITNECLIDCEAVYLFNISEDFYFSGVKYKEKKTDIPFSSISKAGIKNLNIYYNDSKKETKITYDCFSFSYVAENKTLINDYNCTKKVNKIEVEYWKKLNSYNIVFSQPTKIKIELQKNLSNIDHIPLLNINSQEYTLLNFAWFNNSWAKKRQRNLTINYSSDNSLFPIPIRIDTATLINQSLLNTNCSDYRFLNESETGEFYFYIEENTCNRNDTIFWVNQNVQNYTFYDYSKNIDAPIIQNVNLTLKNYLSFYDFGKNNNSKLTDVKGYQNLDREYNTHSEFPRENQTGLIGKSSFFISNDSMPEEYQNTYKKDGSAFSLTDFTHEGLFKLNWIGRVSDSQAIYTTAQTFGQWIRVRKDQCNFNLQFQSNNEQHCSNISVFDLNNTWVYFMMSWNSTTDKLNFYLETETGKYYNFTGDSTQPTYSETPCLALGGQSCDVYGSWGGFNGYMDFFGVYNYSQPIEYAKLKASTIFNINNDFADFEILPIINPLLNIIFPLNNTIFNETNLSLIWNVTNTEISILYEDGVNDENFTGDGLFIHNETFFNGWHTWEVIASNFTLGVSNNSQLYKFYINLSSQPFVKIYQPLNNTLSIEKEISFNYSVINCSNSYFYINDSLMFSSEDNINFLLNYTLGNEFYNYSVFCNQTNSSIIKFSDYYFLNITRPYPFIALDYPLNMSNFSTSNISINFTAFNCSNISFFLDSQLIFNDTQNMSYNLNFSLTNGLYLFSVFCSNDDINEIFTTNDFNFLIDIPFIPSNVTTITIIQELQSEEKLTKKQIIEREIIKRDLSLFQSWIFRFKIWIGFREL